MPGGYHPTKLELTLVESIREYYSRGYFTLKDLGRMFSRHPATISKIINGKTYRNLPLKSKPKKRVTPEERIEIVRLSQTTMLTDRDISKKVKCSEFVVQYHRRKAEDKLLSSTMLDDRKD